MWRRVVLGAGLGAYITALAYSPWAKRSGAHINPAVTLAFFRLGKIRGWDALFYTAAQFAGAVAAVQVMGVVLGAAYADPAIDHVVTKPGPRGLAAAFAAEFAIALLLMAVVLAAMNSRRLQKWAGAFTGVLIAAYLVVETPMSGMSLNPARTFGSAVAARHWGAMWIYFVAPPLAMLLAADVFARVRKGAGLSEPTFPRW
ncbi:hypothetical protein tb265_19130 [Gemmatimonadetes bacterium T265]|nr:hypothetical protein tb265_19130 [Gemmatimonadetes bacterium T265]